MLSTCLSCPTTEAALTLAGLKEDAALQRALLGGAGAPAPSPAVTSSMGHHCTQTGVRDPCLPQDSSSLHCCLRAELLIPRGAPHSFIALTHCSAAWLPQVTFSIKPGQQNSEMCVTQTAHLLTQTGTKAQLQPSLVSLLKEEMFTIPATQGGK